MTTELADDVGFDEAPADESTDTQQTSATAKPGLALVMQKNLTRIQTAMADLDRVESELPDVEKRYATDVVYEITTTKGMKAAIEHRAAWRDRRITVEKARTMAKAPILELGRHVDSRAKRLAEQLRLGEEPIDQQIKAEEKRKDDERQARINAEAGRVLAIQEALAGIGQDVLIACSKTSADIQALIDRMSTTAPEPLVFQEQIDQARAAWSAALVKLDTALKAKRWEEAEAKRIADERAAEEARRVAEQERLARVAAEQAEAARVLAEERAQLARERAELEALRAAQAPAPVPPAPAPESTPEQVAALAQLTELSHETPLRERFANATVTEVPMPDIPAPPAAAPEVVRAALAQTLPAHRVDDGAIAISPKAMHEVMCLIEHALLPWQNTKFASHPKPGPDWFAVLRDGATKLQALLAAEGGAAC